MKMINTKQIELNKANSPRKNVNMVAFFLTGLVISICVAPKGLAQFASPLMPAVGSGSIPSPEISGDSLPSKPTATGAALSIPTSGTPLAHFINPGRTTVYIYSFCKRGDDDTMPGKRLVLTLRPASLTPKVANEISSILGIDLNSGEETIQADATAHQLELLQSVMNPSANDLSLGIATISANNTKQINRPATAAQWAQLRKSGDDSLYINGGVLPTARICARYFVLVAIAFSTVFLIFASTSIIFGQAHGAPRLIATCGGLMLLLMGYSIYKVAVTNLFNADNALKQKFDTIRYFSNQGQVSLDNK